MREPGRERVELERRAAEFRVGRARESLEGRVALIIDDGIATNTGNVTVNADHDIDATAAGTITTGTGGGNGFWDDSALSYASDTPVIHDFSADQWQVVRRVIHTSADFEWQEMIRMHPQAISSGMAAIRQGCVIVTDTNIAGNQCGIKCGVLARIDEQPIIRSQRVQA